MRTNLALVAVGALLTLVAAYLIHPALPALLIGACVVALGLVRGES